MIEHQTTCPFCHDTVPLASSIKADEHDAPEDGDFSICWRCGEVGVFASKAAGGSRKPTRAEKHLIARDADLQFALRLRLEQMRSRD